MAWLAFTFPECPGCHQSWEASRHRDCNMLGAVELNPDARVARCDQCPAQWSVMETNFYCMCGRMFQSHEVEDALYEIIRAAQLLAHIMEQHETDLAEICRAGESSVRRWLSNVAESVGEALGKAVGSLIGSIVRSIFGPR